jgi:hypothetical protein
MQYRYDVVLCGCNDEYDRGEYSETTCPDLGDCSEVPHDELDGPLYMKQVITVWKFANGSTLQFSGDSEESYESSALEVDRELILPYYWD